MVLEAQGTARAQPHRGGGETGMSRGKKNSIGEKKKAHTFEKNRNSNIGLTPPTNLWRGMLVNNGGDSRGDASSHRRKPEERGILLWESR